uniref:SPOC domain-containing protein n=1 Tax=Heterorhabditis bacteriophora TaxID=37862 RepID=A0A1I7XPA4_HETBA
MPIHRTGLSGELLAYLYLIFIEIYYYYFNNITNVFKVESGEARVPADFCSDRLHDHFIDRKHGGNPVLSTADESHACLLAPPPDPPITVMTTIEIHGDHHLIREDVSGHDHEIDHVKDHGIENRQSMIMKNLLQGGRKGKIAKLGYASSDSSSSSSGGSTPTRLRSGSNESRVSSPLSYSQRKERRRDERRDRDRNSNGKFRCSQSGRRSPFGTPKWSDRRSSRHSPVVDERVPHPLAEDRTAPTPDDRKSGDSGFYEDARPPLDPPPAPPPMESLPSVPSPPPADPPPMTQPHLELARSSQCHNPAQTSLGPVFVSPPSTSRQDAIVHQELPMVSNEHHYVINNIVSISLQAAVQSHRHLSMSIPGTSSAVTQKRCSVDGSQTQTRQNLQTCRSRVFKWPWGNGDVARTPVIFPEICNVRLLDPRPRSDLSCRPPILKFSPPPFALFDSTERPRPVDEWRKRSSSSTVSVDGNRRSCGGTPQRQHSSTAFIEEQRSSVRSQSSSRPVVSRSSSSGAESDPQLSPEAPLPPAPPSALDLLCEPDATPSLTDSWSGVRYRLADIGSKLTDVKSSLLEAHKGVDEIQEREPRQPIATQRTDSFEEKLRSISRKKKSSFDEFTLNITQERIQAVKASVPDGSAPLSGLSSCGFTRNVTAPRPALSITIPQPSSASQSTASTPASVKIESPSSARKPSVSLASRPPPSAPAISSSSIVRISAPPTAPVIAYPPNFSVPPPTFAPMLQTTIESQASPLLSAPPPPPQLPPATTVRRDSMSSLKSPPMTPGSCSSWKPSTPSTSTAPTSRCIVQSKEAPSVLSTPKTPLSSKISSKVEKLPTRHDSMSALKSPVQNQHQTSLSGRSLSVSDAKKPAASVPHKDPSTELLAGLFHNKPPTTDFRKLPKIEKKQCTISGNNEKDKKSEHKKEKEHRLRRKEDGTFETKEERSKRKEADRIKKDRTRHKDYKKERKRAFNKQIASVTDEGGALGGYSMYDRVKRRSSAVNRDEGAKKTALQKLREKTNEKKGQKRKRVQLDWSDEDEDSRKRDSEDPETSDPEAENSKKEESMESSDNDTEKKKHGWSSNDSDESEENKKLKKTGKKHMKQRKAVSEQLRIYIFNMYDLLFYLQNKNINMDDVFGANSSDEEKIHEEKKRKKSKKESSDENDVPKKKGKPEKLDFEAIFGSDKPDKHKKKEKSEREEKERREKKDAKKRSPEDDGGKPAKRPKKEPESDRSSCSEGEFMKVDKVDTDCELERNKLSEDNVLKAEEQLNEINIVNTATTTTELPEDTTTISLDQSKEERPRLLTKAALKVFVPSQSSVPASTSIQHSIEVDSGDSDEGYDGVFPGTSQSVPLHVSSSSSCSDNDESDSDSDSRNSHPREVELVDAAAGYASVTSPEPDPHLQNAMKVDKIKSPESPIHEFTVDLKNQDQTRILPVTLIEELGVIFPETRASTQDISLEEPGETCQDSAGSDGDAEKDVRDILDLQETEDAVQSIFDDYEEEQEPQYPSHDFIRADTSETVKTTVADEAERAASAIEEIDNLTPRDMSEEQLESSVEEPDNGSDSKIENEKNDASSVVSMPKVIEEELVMPIPVEIALAPFCEQTVEQTIPSSISVSIPESNLVPALTVPDQHSPLPKTSVSFETSTSTPEPMIQPPSSVIQSKVHISSPQPRVSPSGTNSYSNTAGLAQLPPASVGGLTQGLPIITQASQMQQQQQQYYNLLQQHQQQQQKVTAEAQLRAVEAQSRVSKPQTPVATLSPAPKATTPVCQQQAVLAQAVQMQHMQQILLAGMRQDPIGYYQQISQSCGQQMAAALLSQVMQYPSTSQTQQLIDFQRQQQQYKTHQDSSLAASSPQPQHQQLQERERILMKETQMRALREREQAAALQQHQQAIYAQMRQAFHLNQQQQQGASQGSPAVSQTSSASSATAPVMERKSAAVPPQPRASEDRPVVQIVAPQAASSSPAIAPVVQPLPRADPEMTKRIPVSCESSIPMNPSPGNSLDDMERCLNRILNEEIYNIFEDDLKPEIMEASPSMGTDENSKDMSGSMSPIERKMSIDEILDIISTRSIRDENIIVSVGSAFRKVSSRSLLVEPSRANGISSPQVFTGRNEYLNWTTSVSPPDSSPKSEADLSPLSQEIVIQLRDLALAHRVEDSSSIDQELVLTRDEQLKRFPVVWQGALSMKHWETAVQMHLVTGSTEMLIKCLGDSNIEAKNAVTIKIEQRMRLDNTQVQSVVNKMTDMTQFACMICLPCGLSRDEILSNSATFQTAFIDYFTQKGAAGIANIPAKSSTAGCLVHVFPPGDFPSSYLSYYSPQLFESITSRQASYLFVVLTPEERAA